MVVLLLKALGIPEEEAQAIATRPLPTAVAQATAPSARSQAKDKRGATPPVLNRRQAPAGRPA
jgi:hypothetical protein